MQTPLPPLVRALVLLAAAMPLPAQDAAPPLRVFVFAGQSNMGGADTEPGDIASFPPFATVAEPRDDVRYRYVLGREDKQRSDGWVPLQPVGDDFGPELVFARDVTAHTDGPIAIVKVAAGGTTLGRDWNPERPGGFELYPLALRTVQDALRELDEHGVRWRLEGFVWHQGENDMFDDAFRDAYRDNLRGFIARWRSDLDAPELRFYVGELCEKTVWGMDNRRRMYAIKQAQMAVADADPLVDYVRTSHVGVRRGNPVALHYHYGTLGQLEHGAEHARAYLQNVGIATRARRELREWPYDDDAEIELWVLAGHRTMEGERAFVQRLQDVDGGAALAEQRGDVAFRYATGGGVLRSDGWEPLGPAGLYDTFGPELSFARALLEAGREHVAIAKFTHSGSQIVDWTPEGSEAEQRNLFGPFVAFVQESIADLERRGHRVRLAGIVYHLGENDTAWTPHRRQAAQWLSRLVAATRLELGRPELRWIVSQQTPIAHESVDRIDVTAELRAIAEADAHLTLVEAFDAPSHDHPLVLDTAGVVWLGARLAGAALR